jgi:cyanophycin synthetase
LPATFSGRATMNVQNAMAAAAAAFAAGASLHEIRQGLRTFSTNYYLSPGRLNEVSVAGRNVIIDYCHNVPGMIMLGDFVDKTGDALESTNDLGRISRIGVIATAGDRRNEDMHELGREAARHFDVLIVREDAPGHQGRSPTSWRPEPVRPWPRAGAASRSRSCSRSWQVCGTRCHGPTSATL